MHIYREPVLLYRLLPRADRQPAVLGAAPEGPRQTRGQHYMAYTRQGGSRVFTELLKNAGLDSPFEESCLRGVCETAKAVARQL